jgi:hypothetical protein
MINVPKHDLKKKRSSVLFTEASKGWRGGGLVGRHAEVAAAGDLLAAASLDYLHFSTSMFIL